MERELVGIDGVAKFLRSQFQAREAEPPHTASRVTQQGFPAGGRAKEVDS